MLQGSAAVSALVAAASATPAVAQSSSAPPPAAQADPNSPAPQDGVSAAGPQAPGPGQTDTQGADSGEIVVTGTLFRRNDLETPSPVTQLTADDIAKRGLQTVQAAIQTISSNNGPALTNSFTANGAFAGGASAISLRGLTTNSTLVLFDGLRAAYYPLADDGTRNFVDLNTIPDEIVDRVQVLKDGASSTYGADAVAGVVNIITKKQIVGLHGSAEAGISQQHDVPNHRASLTYGYGDLQTKGFNAYISAHYVDSAALYSRQRGYPYNTDDLTGLCANTGPSGSLSVCGPNLIANGVTNGDYNGGISTAPNVFFVRPYDATNSTAILDADGKDRYRLLNSATGCNGLTQYTLSDDEYSNAANAAVPRTVCQQDITHDYGQIEPKQRRWGASGRVTVALGANAEFYTELNYERSETSYTGLSSIFRSAAPAGIDFPAFTNASGTATLALPVYICARGTTVACTASNGTLNPNNPFAAQGQVARIIGRLPTSTEFNSTRSQVYRAAAGVHGTFGDNWSYSVDGTAMITKLRTQAKGYVYIQHLIDEVADGSYNFVNPGLTSQADLDYLTPTQTLNDSSHLYQGQASLSKELFQLPGGAFQVAIGGAIRYESLNDPSGNPDYNGPTERYFRLNAFGAAGHRYVESGSFEITAPILKQLEVAASGRYDHYSSGQNNFSPKVGAKFTPFKQLAFRGTFSKGFRIPSFAESGALPTTGYVTVSPGSLPDNLIQQHLNPAGTGPNTYLTQYSVGETTVGNPDLKAEKSRNFGGGAIIKPIRDVTFTVDYYNIRKTRAITSVNFQSAIDNYYATGDLAYNGVSIVQDEPDIAHPDGLRRVLYAQGSFINANSIKTSGIDFGVTASHRLSDNVRFTTSGEATYIINLNTKFPDGHTEHYVGTLGNFNLTAGSGTQRWKANWQNTIDVDKASLTVTAYYTSGYNYSAEDQGSVSGDCSLVPTNFNGDAYQGCNVKSFISVDMTGSIKANDHFLFYANVLNVFNRKAPIDATTYGAYLYNPVVGDSGIIGRSFRVGAKVDF